MHGWFPSRCFFCSQCLGRRSGTFLARDAESLFFAAAIFRRGGRPMLNASTAALMSERQVVAMTDDDVSVDELREAVEHL
jgi:hypothetical protein